MPIEYFTREEFEAALPKDKRTQSPLFSYIGILNGEHCWAMPIGDKFRIAVQSSIENGMTVSSDNGENSIRLIVQRKRGEDKWFAIGKGPDAWTTRQPGWDKRLKDKVHGLYLFMRSVKQDFTDDENVFITKKPGPNKGRIFAAKENDKNSFRWLSEAPQK